MSLRLSRLLDQPGISSVFEVNGFTQTVAVDGTVFFSYRTFEFRFNVSKFDKNLIYCDQDVTYNMAGISSRGGRETLDRKTYPSSKRNWRMCTYLS